MGCLYFFDRHSECLCEKISEKESIIDGLEVCNCKRVSKRESQVVIAYSGILESFILNVSFLHKWHISAVKLFGQTVQKFDLKVIL